MSYKPWTHVMKQCTPQHTCLTVNNNGRVPLEVSIRLVKHVYQRQRKWVKPIFRPMCVTSSWLNESMLNHCCVLCWSEPWTKVLSRPPVLNTFSIHFELKALLLFSVSGQKHVWRLLNVFGLSNFNSVVYKLRYSNVIRVSQSSVMGTLRRNQSLDHLFQRHTLIYIYLFIFLTSYQTLQSSRWRYSRKHSCQLPIKSKEEDKSLKLGCQWRQVSLSGLSMDVFRYIKPKVDTNIRCSQMLWL